jgi:hypothetical protein
LLNRHARLDSIRRPDKLFWNAGSPRQRGWGTYLASPIDALHGA